MSQFRTVPERRDKILHFLRRRVKRIPVWMLLVCLILVPVGVRALVAVIITIQSSGNFQSGSSPVVANLGGTQPTVSMCQNSGYTYVANGITLTWTGAFVAGTIVKQYLCLQNVGTGDELIGLSGSPPACTVTTGCGYGTMTSPQAGQTITETPSGCVVASNPASALTVQPSKFAVIELDWCIPANAPVGSPAPSFTVSLT